MHDSKLISLLRSLNEQEFRKLEKFISSPYFMKDRDLTPLYRTLRPFYPEFKGEDITIEKIFSKIFPGKKFEEKKSYNVIKTLSSGLFRAAKDFLIQLEMEEDVKGREYYILNQLRKRKLYKELEKEYDLSQKNKDHLEKGSIKSFVKDHLINTVITDYYLDKDDFDNALENTFMMSERIVAAAIISCFKFEDEKNIAKAYNKEIRRTLMAGILDNTDIEKIMAEYEKENSSFRDYIKVYYMLYQINTHKDDSKYFYEAKKLLGESFHLFGQSENHVLWNMMLTYCNMKFFSDEDKEMRLQVHEIQKMMVSKGIHKRSSGEDFHIVMFRNVVLNALPLKDYEWLENFINTFSKELHSDHRDDMINYSHAYLNYMKGEFEKALEYLIRVKYEIFLYKHDVKMLQIKLYYELNYYEEAFSVIDTLLHYFKNTKDLPEFHISGFKLFITNIRQLLKMKSSGIIDMKELEYLEKNILDDKKQSMSWVIDKIRELKGEMSNVKRQTSNARR